MGFKEQNLSSDISVQMYKDWKVKNCQPNYRTVRNNIWGVMSCQPNYRTVRNNIWGSCELVF